VNRLSSDHIARDGKQRRCPLTATRHIEDLPVGIQRPAVLRRPIRATGIRTRATAVSPLRLATCLARATPAFLRLTPAMPAVPRRNGRNMGPVGPTGDEMAASDARARRFVRILVAVGVSGLSVELAFVAFVLRTGAWGTTTSDRLLSEIALDAVLYGSLFGLAIFARLAPSIGFPPPRFYPDWWSHRMSAKLFRILPALLAPPVILQATFLALGLSTILETAWGLLHWYPIYGILIASLVDAQTVFQWRTVSGQGT